MRIRWVIPALLAGLVAAPVYAAAPAYAATPHFAGAAADGAHVIAEHRVSKRILDVTIASPAARADTTARLLLPPGWSAHAGRTWPVLYLLHGCCDTYLTWDTNTNVASQTKGAPVIVALPDGGPVGFYTNWWNFGAGGENWETYTATELPQILRSGFRAGPRAAIGGVSTGGGAALDIAAHHPGAYVAAAAYSGMDCTMLPTATALIMATVSRAGVYPDNLWGDPVQQRPIWLDHNPCWLARSLRGTQLFLSVGSGVTAAGNAPTCPPGGQFLEAIVARAVYAFAKHLTRLGLPVTKDFYRAGCHDWPWWSTAFDKSWPMLDSALSG